MGVRGVTCLFFFFTLGVCLGGLAQSMENYVNCTVVRKSRKVENEDSIIGKKTICHTLTLVLFWGKDLLSLLEWPVK